ncbi:MAG: ATP phosphoribosyltransferase regulatory subunit [Clostridium sp.]|uniref:ATP phosphoribosyltransferase regulatory subunit n=1 Tax=Clostridium sp. TaxID=1506 RepID=UPI003F3946E7
MISKNVIPEGTRDLVFNECRRKKSIISSLENTFDKWGYDEVITPTIEYYSTFFSGEEGVNEEEVYKFFDGNGRILSLRPDMTVPISRVIGTKMKEVEPPIRLRYTSNVFRVNRTFGGKKNEYVDCGVELVGAKELEGDIEILTAALQTFKNLNIKDFKLEIGNINFFNSLVEQTEINESERENLAVLIEGKSLIELEDFLNGLNIKESSKNFLKRLPWLFGDETILDKEIEMATDNRTKDTLLYLKSINEILNKLGYENNISFDLGMVPGVNYYTGIIFKGYVNGARAAVLSGGRYDNLIKSFGRDLPAVGFSINVDLIWENERLNEDAEIQECTIYYGKNNLVKAISESNKLRSSGSRVKIFLKENDDDFFYVYSGGDLE